VAARQIVKIDEAKCNGCGECVTACAEAAIQIIDGKAKLVSDVYCDGLGACLGHCPQDAISMEERDAVEFDEAATHAHLAQQGEAQAPGPGPFVCPGMQAQQFSAASPTDAVDGNVASQLAQWPVQLALVSPQASYFAQADLLLVADCVPFAMGDFHDRFLKGRAIVIGCPKLDDCQPYIDKLTSIIDLNDLRSFTVVHMEVPCCSGLVHATRQAFQQSSRDLRYTDVTVSIKGEVLLEQEVTQ
jgi:Pyruvate/2-oxoacid:ferredoxin oxidoreductase delta subunit